MNSILQCLSNTQPMTKYILSIQKSDVNQHNPNGARGRFVYAYQTLMRAMWSEISSTPDVLDMYVFKQCVSELDSRFKGSRQQDAQELLNWMIDMLHEETNQRVGGSLSTSTALSTTSQDTSPGASSGVSGAAQQLHPSDTAWNEYLGRNDSLFVQTFYGQTLSQLTCPKCNNSKNLLETSPSFFFFFFFLLFDDDDSDTLTLFLFFFIFKIYHVYIIHFFFFLFVPRSSYGIKLRNNIITVGTHSNSI